MVKFGDATDIKVGMLTLPERVFILLFSCPGNYTAAHLQTGRGGEGILPPLLHEDGQHPDGGHPVPPPRHDHVSGPGEIFRSVLRRVEVRAEGSIHADQSAGSL